MTDRTGRVPKGVMSRQAPDWFADYLATGSFVLVDFANPGGANYIAVGLFNDSTQGEVLKVYGITSHADGGGGYGCYWVNGTVGVLQNQCASIRPDRPAPAGQIWADIHLHVPGPPFLSPFTFAPPQNIIGAPGFDSFTVFSQFPMFIVPVGWSLVLANVRQTFDGGVGYWYQTASA